MAWRAELLRRQWYCICGTFMPEIFSRQLYDEWYASLSEEAKQRLAKKVQKKREKEYRELQQWLRNISTLATAAYQYRDRLFSR
jgi:hypothetical protein